MLDDEPAGAEKIESQVNDYFNSSTKVRIFIHIPHIFNVKRVKKDIYISRARYLSLQNPNLSSIALWSYCEVQPVGAFAVTFYQQFVEVLLALIANVEKNHGISK